MFYLIGKCDKFFFFFFFCQSVETDLHRRRRRRDHHHHHHHHHHHLYFCYYSFRERSKRIGVRKFLKTKFSNSLIIHRVNANKIRTVTAFLNVFFISINFKVFVKISVFFVVLVSIEDIYQTLERVFPSNSKHLEVRQNTPLCVVCSTLLSVFGNRRKHSLSCLIYYLNLFKIIQESKSFVTSPVTRRGKPVLR